MGLTAVRVFADDSGETHLESVEIPTERDDVLNGLSRVELPTTTTTFVEYPLTPAEIVPGFHGAPRRQLVLCLQGSFEVTTTSGDSHVFRPGDWLLADDVGSRGHLTKGVGEGRRVNLAVGLDSEWVLPSQ